MAVAMAAATGTEQTQTDLELIESLWSTPTDGVEPGLADAELLRAARASVARLRSRGAQPAWVRHGDADLVGDVVEACLRAAQRGQHLHAGYVFGVARNLVRRDRDMSSADARALRILSCELAAIAQREFREPTDHDVERIAATIVAEWPEGARRPAAGFHQRHVTISLDALGAGYDLPDTVPAGRSAAGCDDLVVELTEAFERAAGKAAHARVKRGVWDAFAQTIGAAPVSRPLSRRRAAAARAAILGHPRGGTAGIAEAISSWRAGQDCEVLFAPFAADDCARRSVVALLDSYPRYALELWLSAVAAATSQG